MLACFNSNKMTNNPGKFSNIFLGKHSSCKREIKGVKLELVKSFKLIGLIIDIIFHFIRIYQILARKQVESFRSLKRIRNVLDKKHANLLSKSFILPQFNFFSMKWMFLQKNLKIKQIQKTFFK